MAHRAIEGIGGAVPERRLNDQPWRIAASRAVRVGDRVCFFKQGKGARGIFGVGEVLGGSVLNPKGRRSRRSPLPASTVAPPELAPQAPPDVMALPHPDWLNQELTLTGDADALWCFRQAATGAGHVPWVHDYDRLEEHWLTLMLAQPGRTISLQGAKTMAREVEEAFRDEHEEASAWVGAEGERQRRDLAEWEAAPTRSARVAEAPARPPPSPAAEPEPPPAPKALPAPRGVPRGERWRTAGASRRERLAQPALEHARRAALIPPRPACFDGGGTG